MKTLVVFVLLCSAAYAKDVYEGPWKTTRPSPTNRILDGVMTCEVRRIEQEKWSARFYGVWQGQSFDYTVNFTGPASALVGKATIDGASYDWKGDITLDRFKGTFTGSRYHGYFDMKAKK